MLQKLVFKLFLLIIFECLLKFLHKFIQYFFLQSNFHFFILNLNVCVITNAHVKFAINKLRYFYGN